MKKYMRKRKYMLPVMEVMEVCVESFINTSPVTGEVYDGYVDEGEEELAKMRYEAITGEQFGNLW